MKRFVQLPRLNQIRFLRSTAVLRGRSESKDEAFNTDSKVYDAHGRIVHESSTREVRNWKESQATESEADVKADRGEIEAGRENSDQERKGVEQNIVAELPKQRGSKS